MRRQTVSYPEIIHGRPDLPGRIGGKPNRFGITRAKTHPPYVHGKVGMAALLHKIAYVDLWWYKPMGDYLVRLASPRMLAYSVCGSSWSIDGTRAKTCELPDPQAVLCGMCHGTGRIWPRGEKSAISKREARVRLGCVAKGSV